MDKKKNVEYYLCDTFEGVVNSSKKDTFFTDKEYSDASIEDVKSATSLINNSKVNLVSGTFPESFKNINLKHPISFAHIDVDTYNSAKDSIDFIFNNSVKGAVIVLDDYGGWFTDGVTKLGNELKVLTAKARFIQYNLDDKIDLRKKSKSEINSIMEKFEFEVGENGEYNYLIKMPMDSVSKENVEKLMKEHENKKAELEGIQNSTIEAMWLKELGELKTAYNEFLENSLKMEKTETLEKTKKSKKK